MAKYVFKSNGHAQEYFNGKKFVEPEFGNFIKTDDPDEAEALSRCHGLTLVETEVSSETIGSIKTGLESVGGIPVVTTEGITGPAAEPDNEPDGEPDSSPTGEPDESDSNGFQ